MIRGIVLGIATQQGTSPAITLSGVPSGVFTVLLEIQTGGAVGTSTFRYSANNGASWIASSVATAASVALTPTGITASFATGTYNAGDSIKASSYPAMAM